MWHPLLPLGYGRLPEIINGPLKEPYFITPFIQWLPRCIGQKCLQLTLRYLITRDLSRTERIWEEVRLLKRGEIRELFPDAEIRFERFMGFPKSIWAIKR